MNALIRIRYLFMVFGWIVLICGAILFSNLHSMEGAKRVVAEVTGSDITVRAETETALSCVITEAVNLSDADGNTIDAVTEDDATDTFYFNSVGVYSDKLTKVLLAGTPLFYNPYYIKYAAGEETAEVLTSSGYTLTVVGTAGVNKTIALNALTGTMIGADGARYSSNPSYSDIDNMTTPTTSTGILEQVGGLSSETGYNVWTGLMNLAAPQGPGTARLSDSCSI